MTIADEVHSQLTQTMESFTEWIVQIGEGATCETAGMSSV
jgi:hypothetical protein